MSSAVSTTPVGEFLASVSPEFESGSVERGHLDAYAVDAAVPDVAIRADTIEHVRTTLIEAQDAGLHVIARGGGTHLGIGNCPAEYDVALALGGMGAVLAYEPADMTVTVEPGVRLDRLQQRLAEQGQFLPLDPPCDAAATVGGVLAANVYGPRRHAYGTARDWLLGTRIVHADGAITKSGGRVVKNVTGYDMHKLYVGSLGTLGVLVEATLKVAPLPKVDSTIAIGCHTAHEAALILREAAHAGLALHAGELLAPGAANAVLGEARWTVLARVAGGQGAADRTTRDLAALAAPTSARIEERTADVWEAWSKVFRPGVLTMRVVVAPSMVAEVMQILDRQFIGAAALLSATPAAGVIRAQLSPTREARGHALVVTATDVAKRHDGFVVVDAAPMSLKRQVDVFGPTRPDFAIMRRLKEALDPQRTLSPGRFAGRL